MSEKAKSYTNLACAKCADTEVSLLSAWNNKQPPGPGMLHVAATVKVPNPGVDPMLVAAVPQGINPSILILDILFCQQPGEWIQIPVCKPVRYEQPINPMLVQVDLRCGSDIVGSAKIFDAV